MGEGQEARSLKGHTIHPGPVENPRNLRPQKLSYLLVGVRPVEAQEEVGGLTVEEEISCPEWDRKAMDRVAEVKCDPEVLGISICKDVLQEKTGTQSSTRPEPPSASPTHVLTHAGQGDTGFHSLSPRLPASPGNERMLSTPKQAQ